jgi:hypothetical protein
MQAMIDDENGETFITPPSKTVEEGQDATTRDQGPDVRAVAFTHLRRVNPRLDKNT